MLVPPPPHRHAQKAKRRRRMFRNAEHQASMITILFTEAAGLLPFGGWVGGGSILVLCFASFSTLRLFNLRKRGRESPGGAGVGAIHHPIPGNRRFHKFLVMMINQSIGCSVALF
jgi:hypothetical protein